MKVYILNSKWFLSFHTCNDIHPIPKLFLSFGTTFSFVISEMESYVWSTTVICPVIGCNSASCNILWKTELRQYGTTKHTVVVSFVSVLFFSPTLTKLPVSSSTSNKETIETAEKSITTTSYQVTEEKGVQLRLDDQFFVAQAQRRHWRWKVCRLSVTFVLLTVVPGWGTEKLFYKEEEAGNI